MFIHAAGYFPSQHWFTAHLPYLIQVATEGDEIADCTFHQEKEGDKYLFQILFLIKQNQNVGLCHVFRECVFSQLTSELTNILHFQQTRKVYTQVSMAIGYQITSSIQLTSCLLVHVHIKSLSKLHENPISFWLYVFMATMATLFQVYTWLMVFNLEKHVKSF